MPSSITWVVRVTRIDTGHRNKDNSDLNAHLILNGRRQID